MAITGIPILGKISVGVRMIAKRPRITIRIDATTKVYGRRIASRTIHIFYRSPDGRQKDDCSGAEPRGVEL
jgi:hypothetical protein